jgi:hypothetical protein
LRQPFAVSFHARLLSGRPGGDQVETSDARWFTIGDIPALPIRSAACLCQHAHLGGQYRYWQLLGGERERTHPPWMSTGTGPAGETAEGCLINPGGCLGYSRADELPVPDRPAHAKRRRPITIATPVDARHPRAIKGRSPGDRHYHQGRNDKFRARSRQAAGSPGFSRQAGRRASFAGLQP